MGEPEVHQDPWLGSPQGDPWSTREAEERGLRSWRGSRPALLVALATGTLAVVLYSSQGSTWSAKIATISVASMVAGAALLVGGLIGFLFGIPLSGDAAGGGGSSNGEKPHTESAFATKSPSAEGRYRPNTNLEQISDWLTKILVGVGLVESASIRDAVLSTARSIKLGGGFDAVFATGLLVYFCICGFFLSFLWTRLHLAGLYTESDGERLRLEGMRAGYSEGERNLARTLGRVTSHDDASHSRRGLWVDDVPANNDMERDLLEKKFNISWEIARSTSEAMKKVSATNFDLIISDMGRPEGPKAGYDLLQEIRSGGRNVPFVVYSKDSDRWDGVARSKGALGSTSSLSRLTLLVSEALARSSAAD